MTSDNSSPNEGDGVTLQAGASMVFGLLGRALFSYPEREWLQPIYEHKLFEGTPFAASQPDVEAGLALLSALDEEQPGWVRPKALEELQADYTRLFIGPDHLLAAPWESVHRSVDRLLFQEQTLQVREWYSRFGLEAVNRQSEPDDHVGLELAFLSHLSTSAAEAEENGDEAAVARLVEAERGFLAEHPINWVPMWCELVIRNARTDFYRGAALFTRGALTGLAAMLGVRVPEWELDQI